MDIEKPKAVIRYFDSYHAWGICHAKSYQSAFSSGVNNFKRRNDAAEFASLRGFEVVKHENDQLQALK